jgi:hypothetical protein
MVNQWRRIDWIEFSVCNVAIYSVCDTLQVTAVQDFVCMNVLAQNPIGMHMKIRMHER